MREKQLMHRAATFDYDFRYSQNRELSQRRQSVNLGATATSKQKDPIPVSPIRTSVSGFFKNAMSPKNAEGSAKFF
jgi:hypothetical protein